jgi:transglutaminase-like putative cysteine protease
MTDYQECHRYRLEIEPGPSTCTKRPDYFGNEVEYFAIQEAHERLRVTATSDVTVSARPPWAPDSTPAWETLAAGLRTDVSNRGLSAYHLSLASPRAAPSDALREYARPCFAKGLPIGDAARELTRRIFTDFTFDADATTIHTQPDDLLQLRRGVCQDFAHLAIGCLRSFGLAARYVSGYVRTKAPPGAPRLLGADASHAWVSVFCGPAGWIDFDPTNDVEVGESHITIGWGRDYGDVGPIQGVFVGGGKHTMTVGVDVVPRDACEER